MWIAGAQVFVGVLQWAVVAWGIRAMVRETDKRARETAAAAERARREADQRHAETMAAFKTQSRALEALIERTTPGAAQ